MFQKVMHIFQALLVKRTRVTINSKLQSNKHSLYLKRRASFRDIFSRRKFSEIS